MNDISRRGLLAASATAALSPAFAAMESAYLPRRMQKPLTNCAGGQRINREWVNAWLSQDFPAFYFQKIEL